VAFWITNTGDVAGKEIAQVYIRPLKSSVFRPLRELKGFAKVLLQPGETTRVEVTFDDHTLAYFDVGAKSWITLNGEYVVEVGASVQDIRLQQNMSTSPGKVGVTQYDKKQLGSYYSGRVQDVSDVEFETLLGRVLPPARWNRKLRLGYDDTITQLQYRGFFARMFFWLLQTTQQILFFLKQPNAANNMTFILGLPFSKIPSFTGGRISERMIKRLLGIRRS
jgi:beta-glucosidase